MIDILDWYNNQRKKDGQNNHVVVRGKKNQIIRFIAKTFFKMTLILIQLLQQLFSIFRHRMPGFGMEDRRAHEPIAGEGTALAGSVSGYQRL